MKQGCFRSSLSYTGNPLFSGTIANITQQCSPGLRRLRRENLRKIGFSIPLFLFPWYAINATRPTGFLVRNLQAMIFGEKTIVVQFSKGSRYSATLLGIVATGCTFIRSPALTFARIWKKIEAKRR